MNRLVEYMARRHPATHTAFMPVLVDELIEETGWTREEIFNMAREASAAGELSVTYVSKGNRWGNDQAIPEDLSIVSSILQSVKDTTQRYAEYRNRE